MWTGDHRRAADRRGLRYPSDLTDAGWELVRPFIRPAKRGGRPRSVDIREVLNAIFYVLSTGCQWNAIPSDPAPQHRLGLPRSLGMGRHHRPSSRRALRREPRTRRARRQSDNGDPRRTERQGRRKRGRSLDPSGYDAGKKVLGRKRHVLVDTQGLLLNVDVHAADIQSLPSGLTRGTVTAPKHCCDRRGGASPSSSVSLPMLLRRAEDECSRRSHR